jgi:DNA polymerase-3 subunit alpha
VKFDFLGLTTLTIIRRERAQHPRARRAANSRSSASRSTIRAAYKVFSSGNTVAIFQFESRGMRDLIMKAKPDRLEDLIALNALYRPGPMDLIPEFIERKHGASAGSTWIRG